MTIKTSPKPEGGAIVGIYPVDQFRTPVVVYCDHDWELRMVFEIFFANGDFRSILQMPHDADLTGRVARLRKLHGEMSNDETTHGQRIDDSGAALSAASYSRSLGFDDDHFGFAAPGVGGAVAGGRAPSALDALNPHGLASLAASSEDGGRRPGEASGAPAIAETLIDPDAQFPATSDAERPHGFSGGNVHDDDFISGRS